MILALDLGTLTGYAVGGDNLPPRSGVLNLTPIKGDHPGHRFLLFAHHLTRLHNKHHFDKIYYEHVAHIKFVKAAQMWGGLQAYMLGWTMTNKVGICHVEVKTLKKFATGNGNANKDMMVKAAFKKGWIPQDDNEADALWILEYALRPAPIPPLFEESNRYFRGEFGYYQTKATEPTLHHLDGHGDPLCGMQIKSSQLLPWTISWVDGTGHKICAGCDEKHKK